MVAFKWKWLHYKIHNNQKLMCGMSCAQQLKSKKVCCYFYMLDYVCMIQKEPMFYYLYSRRVSILQQLISLFY